jgi:hypothetical protein
VFSLSALPGCSAWAPCLGACPRHLLEALLQLFAWALFNSVLLQCFAGALCLITWHERPAWTPCLGACPRCSSTVLCYSAFYRAVPERFVWALCYRALLQRHAWALCYSALLQRFATALCLSALPERFASALCYSALPQRLAPSSPSQPLRKFPYYRIWDFLMLVKIQRIILPTKHQWERTVKCNT